jgi:hypothetical protein
MALAPIRRISVTALSTSSGMMSQMTTFAPSAANARAVASPIPPPDAVTIAIFPRKRTISSSHRAIATSLLQPAKHVEKNVTGILFEFQVYTGRPAAI